MVMATKQQYVNEWVRLCFYKALLMLKPEFYNFHIPLLIKKKKKPLKCEIRF